MVVSDSQQTELVLHLTRVSPVCEVQSGFFLFVLFVFKKDYIDLLSINSHMCPLQEEGVDVMNRETAHER